MTTKILMALALALVILLVTRTLIKRDHSGTSPLNLDDFLLGDDGKASKAAAVMFGAFGVTSWLMVYLTLSAKMSEGYLAAYLAAWVAPTLTRLITTRATPTVAITETSTVSTSKTATPTGV